MFEEVTEILSRASRYDFRLLPLYAECQSVADETLRLLGPRSRSGSGHDPASLTHARDHGVSPHGDTIFRKSL